MISYAPQDIWLILRDHVAHVGGENSPQGRDPWQGTYLKASGVKDFESQGGVPLWDDAKGLIQGWLYWCEKGPNRKKPGPNARVNSPLPIDYVGAWANVLSSHLRVRQFDGNSFLATALPLRDMDLNEDDWYEPLEILGFTDDPAPPTRKRGTDTPPPNPTSTIERTGSGTVQRFPGSGGTSTQSGLLYAGQFELNEDDIEGRLDSSPLPSLWPILWLGGTERASLHPIGVAGFTNTLISDYRSPVSREETFSTRLVDLEEGGEIGIDAARIATLASALRVVGVVDQTRRSVALSWGFVPGSDLEGRGQFISHGRLSHPEPATDAFDDLIRISGISTVEREPEPTETVERAPPSRAIGYAADTGGGPVSVGSGRADKHQIGLDQDGVTHVVGHLDLVAPWYFSTFYDAPPEFSGQWKLPALTGAGIWKPVYLRYDPDRQHTAPGKDFASRSYPGLMRWQTPTLVFVPDPPLFPPEDQPPPIPPPNDPPPDTTPPLDPPLPPEDGGDPPDPPPGPLPKRLYPLHPGGMLGPIAAADQDVDENEKRNITDLASIWMELSSPGLVFRPSLHGENDLRLQRAPSLDDIRRLLEQPAVARLEAFGTQDGEDWSKDVSQGIGSLYHYGASAGGIQFMPANREIEGKNTFGDPVTACFNLWQGTEGATCLSWGVAHQTGDNAGLVTDGFARTMDSGDLVTEALDSAGAATGIESLDSSGNSWVAGNVSLSGGTEFTATLDASGIGGSRTQTLQDGDGTLAFLSDIPAAAATNLTSYVNAAAATHSANIPLDNTVPQNTEGTALFSHVWTPASVGDILRITAVVHAAHDNAAGAHIILALFDSVSGASAVCTSTKGESHVDALNAVPLEFDITATASHLSGATISLRVGVNSGNIYVNRIGSGGLFGGSLKSYFQVTELPV